MSRFDFITDKESEDFCTLIANKMVELFNISIDEAISRINRDWKGQEITGMDNYHETEEHWAKMIYYGEGYWWKGEGNLKPRPFEMSNPEIPKHLESTQK